MKLGIVHRTQYAYATAVRDSFNELRLRPGTDEDQTVDSFLLKVTPPTRLQDYRDFYANCVHHFDIREPHDCLVIESRLEVTTHPRRRLEAEARPGSRTRLREALDGDGLYDFVQASRYVDTEPATWRLAMDAAQEEDDVWQCALRLMRFVNGHLGYQSQSTQVHTHMREVLAQRRGVCQDFAHVMIGMCRTLRMPARYISGYLATETASAMHAWMEVFVPGAGWQALDPTHNRQTDETYVKIAAGRDYGDVAPVRGTYRGTMDRKMTVEVKIERRD